MWKNLFGYLVAGVIIALVTMDKPWWVGALAGLGIGACLFWTEKHPWP